ncbi:MAG: histidinol-phosphatase HisJ family protein [Acetatifactor sp.]|nr:histidinol-phosphatase HisJ family protein [Acetatifactor sp.]
MPNFSDFHLHSAHSGDSDAPMEEMILSGISLGLDSMCFTEHMDLEFPDSPEDPGSIFLLDPEPYLREFTHLKDKYREKIRLLFGVELGLQPQVANANAAFVRSYDFDFVIGSTHVCNGKDPCCPSFFQGRSEQDAFREYFESILKNIQTFSDFDVCGHLDYAIRYAPNMDRNYCGADYQDIMDAILKLLLEKGKGIELNTGGIKKGMKEFHPCTFILKRYRELGGEVITLGSDSHDTAHIAHAFEPAAELLKESGFDYYTVFEKRTPKFVRLA